MATTRPRWKCVRPGYYRLVDEESGCHDALLEYGDRTGYWFAIAWPPEGQTVSDHFNTFKKAKAWATGIADGSIPPIAPYMPMEGKS